MRCGPAILLAALLVGPGCSNEEGAPADAGVADARAPADAAAADGAASDAQAPDAGAPAEHILARFASFDTHLPAFDVCVRTVTTSGNLVGGPPILSAIAGLEDGLGLDRVSARVPIPLIRRENARGAELFLVDAATTDCAAASPISGAVFGLFAERDGERNSFVATDPILMTLVRERSSCPAAAACVHFFNFSSRTSGELTTLSFDLVDGATRTPVLRDVGTGNDGPAEPGFVFDINTGTTELPVTSTAALHVAVRDPSGPAFIEVPLPDAAAQVFSFWVVGHPDASGAAGRRVILCRDLDPDSGGFASCTRHAP